MEQPSTTVRSLVTERTPLRIVEVHIQIGATALVPVRMGWIESDAVAPILGRLDVFEHYTFELNHQQRMVIVRQ